LQQGIDPVAAGCLFAVFQSGEGHGFADALAELLLGQAQVQPPLFDVFSQKDVFQGCVSSSAMNGSIIPCPPGRTKTNPRIAHTSWSIACSGLLYHTRA